MESIIPCSFYTRCPILINPHKYLLSYRLLEKLMFRIKFTLIRVRRLALVTILIQMYVLSRFRGSLCRFLMEIFLSTFLYFLILCKGGVMELGSKNDQFKKYPDFNLLTLIVWRRRKDNPLFLYLCVFRLSYVRFDEINVEISFKLSIFRYKHFFTDTDAFLQKIRNYIEFCITK